MRQICRWWYFGLLYFLLAAKPLEPLDVLTTDELQEIGSTQDFFLHKEMEGNTLPIWKMTNRQYSSHFLKTRDTYLSMDDAVHHVLTDGFPIQYKVQELFRAKMQYHRDIGDIVPQLNLEMGQGIGFIDVGALFSGLFGFLLPANWLNLKSDLVMYEVAKRYLLKMVLDEIMNAKIAYINQHKLIQDFEILNFYFIHTQILCNLYGSDSPWMLLLRGAYGAQGTTMAAKRADVKLGFDSLALAIALEKLNDQYTAKNFNIKDIENFDFEVPDLSESDEECYKTPEGFLQAVVQKSGESLELNAVKKLYELSKLNVGVIATGGSLGATIPTSTTIANKTAAQFSIVIGYGNLPFTLMVNSFSSTAFIDVKSEFMKMINAARTSYDLYNNGLGIYTESKESLKNNRLALFKVIKDMLEQHQEPNSQFLFPMANLIDAELKLNTALHNAALAKTYMDRFLLLEEKNAMKYLPAKGQIMTLFRNLAQKTGREAPEPLTEEFTNIHSSKKLDAILNHHDRSNDWRHYSKDEIAQAVHENIGNLLYSKIRGLYKSKKFYGVLDAYIKKSELQLTSQETFLLERKQWPWYRSLLRKSRKKEDALHSFEFDTFNSHANGEIAPVGANGEML